jgi:hypothetical protein
MIDSITIKNVATYDNEGIQINNLKKVNFIYGANGTGKTTISNYLKNQNDDKYNDCEIIWKNNLSVSTLVYNKKFRDENFGLGKIKGVFTLGQATTEQIAEINTLKEKLNSIREQRLIRRGQLEQTEQEKQNLENEFDEDCWNNLKKEYEDDFSEAFSGWIKSRNKFRNKLEDEFKSNNSDILTYEQLKGKANILFRKHPQMIELINTISFDTILEIENNPIWKKKIVGKADIDIAGLINYLNISDWVYEGKNYLQEESDICPFCQERTITEDFREKLNSFFNENYISDIACLKELKQKYEMSVQNLIDQLNIIEANQKNINSSKLNLDIFSTYIRTLISQYNSNKELLNSKLKEPSRSIDLVFLKEQLELILNLIVSANKEIENYNRTVENFQTEKNKLITSVWKYLVEEYKSKIESFQKKRNVLEKKIIGLNNSLEKNRNDYREIDKKIKELNQDVTSIQPTIDEINRLLNSFGFLNFKIVPSTENGFYEIQREDGSDAQKTLSEGEITFITFLYYYQKVKGGDSPDVVNEDKILVIDDPISSLDSNVLFIVSTLIKDFIKEMKDNEYKGNIKQIILLTHNVYFHKEVSYMDRGAESDKLNYWILRKNGNISSIEPYDKKNPIKSSYQLLWKELQSKSVASTITIQNIMRRILENYFKVLGSYKDEEKIIKEFPNSEEQQICRSLYYWINDGSHCFSDALEIDTQDTTTEIYQEVFRKIFEYSGHIAHYDMMMGISESD